MHETFPRTIRGQLDRAYAAMKPAGKGDVRSRVADAMGVSVHTVQSWDQGRADPGGGVVAQLERAVGEIEEAQKFAKIRRDRSVSDWKTRAIRALDILPDEVLVDFAMKLDRAAAVHQALGEYRADVLAAINAPGAKDARADLNSVLPDPEAPTETPVRTQSGAGA